MKLTSAENSAIKDFLSKCTEGKKKNENKKPAFLSNGTKQLANGWGFQFLGSLFME